jgi:hypothetical protein
MTLEVQRLGEHDFIGRNERGAEVRLGRKGQQGAFSRPNCFRSRPRAAPR